MTRTMPVNGVDHPDRDPEDGLRIVELAPKAPNPIDVPTTRPAPVRPRPRLVGRRVRMADLAGGRALAAGPAEQGMGGGAVPAPLRPRSRFLARTEEHSAEARRGRLADRLAQLAKQRRQEEEQARIEANRALEPKLTVSEAVPLEQLGFMALMLRPARPAAAPSPSARPVAAVPALPVAQAVTAQAGVHAVEVPAVQADKAQEAAIAQAVSMGAVSTEAPDIAVLMEIYRAQAQLSAATAAPDAPPPAASPPVPRLEPRSAATPAIAPQVEALATLDPARRLAGIIPNPAEVELPAPTLVPRPAEAQTGSAHSSTAQVTAVVPHTRARAQGAARTPPAASGWRSFAAGFGAAVVFGIGLYVYLVTV